MATSTIGAAKANLYTALNALTATTLSGVVVGYSLPYPLSPEYELLYLGDVLDWTQDVAAMRNPGHPRDESFDIEIVCRVQKNGVDQQQAANERGVAILAVVEDYLRNNTTIGGAVRVAQFAPNNGRLEEFPADNARIVLLTAHVHCESRI